MDAVQRGDQSPYVWAHPTGTSERVSMSPLATGSQMLAHIPICERPAVARWNEASYQSATPWVCEVRDALVHTCAGIIAIEGLVLADTLIHTTGDEYRYEATDDAIHLLLPDKVERLHGCWLALLTGNHRNYFHWTLDCLGRLASANDELLAHCQHVLVPPLDAEFRSSGLALSGLSRLLEIREMPAAATFEVERLLVPWSLAADLRPPPCLGRYFRMLACSSTHPIESLPRRFYIARRASLNRRLINEDEVIAALARMGFVAIELERLSLAEQIALFSHAEVVVAPHGAGLANLVYAAPGCRLIELHMDSYVNWCFRRLAAASDVQYDCVIGCQLPGIGTVHAQRWSVSVTHMLGAVEQMLV